MIDLARYTELVVRQEVEHLEVFVGFETANRYSIHTPEGVSAMYAAEESGALTRQFMGTHRPLTIRVVDSGGQPVLTASRKFYWFYSHLHVEDESGSPIGSLKRQFAMMRRRFSLLDANASQIGQIDGGPFRRNTFTRGEQSGRRARTHSQAVERPGAGGFLRRRHLPDTVQRPGKGARSFALCSWPPLSP